MTLEGFDGVLVDSMELCLPRWNAISKKLGNGKNITRKIVKQTFRGGWQNFYQTILGVPQIKLDEANEIYRKLSKKSKKPELFPGIKDVVSSLSEKFTLYVVTASSTDNVKNNLKEQGILKYLQDVWGQDKMPNLKKSQPEFILTPLQYWKIKPSNACSIGDTEDEIRTGKLAGLHTIACTWGWNDVSLLKKVKPEFIVNNPSQILRAVSQLNN